MGTPFQEDKSHVSIIIVGTWHPVRYYSAIRSWHTSSDSSLANIKAWQNNLNTEEKNE